MKRLLLIILLLFSNSINAQECEYLGLDKGFENGDRAYLFGDNVKLRKGPSSESETLDTLKIGSRIDIIKKSLNTLNFKGIDSPWYKVSYKDEVGYVLGGLISLTEVKNKNVRCLVNLEKTDSTLYILTRLLSSDRESYFENKSVFLGDNNGFCLKLFDNKGLQGISNILFINYLPESCGANSGGYYLFYDNKKLHKVIDVTSSGDVGLWRSENLYFPKDSLGIENKIIYIKEEGEYSESEIGESEPDWEKSSKIKLKLEWIDDGLKPDPKTFGNNGYK